MERAPVPSGLEPGIKRLRLKVAVLVTLIPLVIAGLVVYALYARGVFEAYRAIALLARDAEGVSVGMPVSFSGFAVGNVTAMEMNEQGKVRIDLRIREREAHWLRSSSVFMIDRPLIGSPTIRASTPNLQDPPLAKNAVFELVEHDAAAEMPQMAAKVDKIMQSVDRLVRPGSDLDRSLASLRVLTARMAGEYGALEGITGNAARAQQIMDVVTRLDGAVKKIDTLLAKTDERMFGERGAFDELQRSLQQINATLANVQAVANDLKGISAGVKDATADLGVLRSEVDESIRKVNRMLGELDRKWPFSNEPQIKLP